MMGILYLFLCFGTGWLVCSFGFPKLKEKLLYSYDGKEMSLNSFFLLLPAWFISGTLLLTWSVYLVAAIFAGISREPILIANAIVLPMALVAYIGRIYYKLRLKKEWPSLSGFKIKSSWCEEFVFVGSLILAFVLMYSTFYIRGGDLFTGTTVFSDFSPHLGMIRSFSYGNNFPTTYPFYGGKDIRYHFMFQFLVGNLEFLGLRIDHAFNLPSIISFMGAFMLLYVIAVKITGRRGAGLLSCLFFAFRSSNSLFTYIANIPKGSGIWKTLSENTEFIGYTTNENWGLWNLNVYCNQRHLAFGLCAMFFIILLFLEPLYEMSTSLRIRRNKEIEGYHGDQSNSDKKGASLGRTVSYLFFNREGWIGKDYRQAAVSGVLLGALSFFHGSAVVGTLTVLFVVAIFSKRRLEFLIVAALAMILSLLQTNYFISGSAVSAEFLFGFIAENKTLFGVASYLERLLGVLPVVLVIALCTEKIVGRYLILAFSMPLIFAFTISLTVDVTVNHKFIMMSCILLGIFVAKVILRLIEQRDIIKRITAAVLVLFLTATGVYDLTTILRKNDATYIVMSMEDPLTEFVRENSTSQDLFLTHTTNYALNQLVFGGAMLYQGHQYFGWSAGYDTAYRDTIVSRMYEAPTSQELDLLVKSEGIRYIVVEWENRHSADYALNEENIRDTYECVYEEGEGDGKTSIYDTHKPIY